MALLVFAVVAVTSFVVAAGPRLFNHVADDGLRYAVAHATAVGRNFQFSTVDRVRADDTDPARTRRAARRVDPSGACPDSVEGLIADTRYVVNSTRFRLADPPKFTTFVTLRQADALEDQLDLVAGRWPARAVIRPKRDQVRPARSSRSPCPSLPPMRSV